MDDNIYIYIYIYIAIVLVVTNSFVGLWRTKCDIISEIELLCNNNKYICIRFIVTHRLTVSFYQIYIRIIYLIPCKFVCDLWFHEVLQTTIGLLFVKLHET